MVAFFVLAFCRWVIGIVFFWALIGKVQDIPSFVTTIERFKLFPNWFTRPIAFLCLIGEGAVIISMLIGDPMIVPGFFLATVMLIAFCFALGSVLLRRIQTPCNCFGKSNQMITRLEMLRDLQFILCGVAGTYISLINTATLVKGDWWIWGTAGGAAVVYVLIGVQMKEFLWVLRFRNNISTPQSSGQGN